MWQKARILGDSTYGLNGRTIYVKVVHPRKIYEAYNMYETNLADEDRGHIAVSCLIVELLPIFEETVEDIQFEDYKKGGQKE